MPSSTFSNAVRYAFASGHSSIGALKDRFGSQVAVEQPRMDFIAWTAGIGQSQTFAATQPSVLLGEKVSIRFLLVQEFNYLLCDRAIVVKPVYECDIKILIFDVAVVYGCNTSSGGIPSRRTSIATCFSMACARQACQPTGVKTRVQSTSRR